MRCKHCREVFQARARSAEAIKPAVRGLASAVTPLPPTTAATPAARPAPSRGDPFAFDDEPEAPAEVPVRRGADRQRRPAGGGLKKGILLAVCVGAAAAVVFFFARPHLANLIGSKKDSQVAGDDKGRSDKAPSDKSGSSDKYVSSDKSTNPRTDKNKPWKNPKKDKANPKKTPIAHDAYPRRALLINVDNYLFANSLHYGSPRFEKYPGSSTAVLKDQLSRAPMHIPATQITELSDGARDAKPTLKPVIEKTIKEFVDLSRSQDRIIVLFTGHAVDIEKDAYLVPLEGDMSKPETLVSLKWVYDQLAKCPAWQKVLILDVCRYPPARGIERPGSGEMGDVLADMLKKPPAGVQVWASCSKGQQAIEFEAGSVFLQSLCNSLQERIGGIQEPTDPLPIDTLFAKVRDRMKELLEPEKLEQTPQLAGKAPGSSGPFDAAEPLPDQLVIRPPGGEVAGKGLVNGILDEINRIPPARAFRPGGENLLNFAYLPPFPAKKLQDYKADYASFVELTRKVTGNPKEFPLRAAVMDASQALRDNAKFKMKESLTSPGGPVSGKIKEAFLRDQREPGIAIFELERALDKLNQAADERDKEPSRRWQAHYDYTKARLMSRLVYTYEYNFILAQVRSDSLPELNPRIHNGWRVGSRATVQIKEAKVKEMVKDIGKLWKKIMKQYPDSPWYIMARRESITALGLEWRASRD
jgi:hypothetical protein